MYILHIASKNFESLDELLDYITNGMGGSIDVYNVVSGDQIELRVNKARLLIEIEHQAD